MSKLYDNWCGDDQTQRRRKTLWRLSELKDGREHALEELPNRVLSHYVSDEEVAVILETLVCCLTNRFNLYGICATLGHRLIRGVRSRGTANIHC